MANIDSKITKEEIYKIIEEVVANNYNEHSNRIKNETKNINCCGSNITIPILKHYHHISR